VSWPAGLPVIRVRIARPTDRLDEVVEFYRDGVGLVELGRFDGHSGYDGVMLGLPGSDYHLEFTSPRDGSPCPAPDGDNLPGPYGEAGQAGPGALGWGGAPDCPHAIAVGHRGGDPEGRGVADQWDGWKSKF